MTLKFDPWVILPIIFSVVVENHLLRLDLVEVMRDERSSPM